MQRCSHPVADVIGSTDIYESPNTPLKQRADVELRRERIVIQVRPERGADGGRVSAKIATHGCIDPKQFLGMCIVKEIVYIPVAVRENMEVRHERKTDCMIG